MMPRYFSRPRSFWVEDEHYSEPVQTETLMVDDHVATNTGLLDAKGDIIWRAPPPMGFGRRDD